MVCCSETSFGVHWFNPSFSMNSSITHIGPFVGNWRHLPPHVLYCFLLSPCHLDNGHHKFQILVPCMLLVHLLLSHPLHLMTFYMIFHLWSQSKWRGDNYPPRGSTIPSSSWLGFSWLTWSSNPFLCIDYPIIGMWKFKRLHLIPHLG